LISSKTAIFLFFLFSLQSAFANPTSFEKVEFKNGSLNLRGELYKPKGKGPFPAILYNHGSAPGMLNSQASEILGPLFANRGWVFFMPYRRGQGLSQSAGPYIMDEIRKAEKKGGHKEAVSRLIHLLKTDHLSDEMAGYEWLKQQKFVQKSKIAVAGNSFGGILTVLGAEKIEFCAAINASGAAQSWADAKELQNVLKQSVRNSKVPLFFFQPENDYDLTPSKILSEEMKRVGKKFELKIYPAFGDSVQEGHSFAYKGSAIWAADVFNFLERNCLN
jgi:carboxymethylenebutenolidase